MPDAHVTESSDLTRFQHVADIIDNERPDVIINMGDFTALNSISHWDKDKRLTMEGQRYQKEMEKCNAALNIIDHRIQSIIMKQRIQKTKQYQVKKYYLEGNHEFWIWKFLEDNPSMKGHVNLHKDLALRARNWNVIPYKEYLEIQDILFTHIPFNGSNQPISGSDITTVASRYTSKSLVFAHTHRLETKTFRWLGASNPVQILTCGCFFETKAESSFDLNNWKGIVMLDVFAPGRFEIRTYSLERMLNGQ